jgi:hypothetical protein
MTTKTRLLNRSAVREFALAVLARDRAHLAGKLTRISPAFYERLEVRLRVAVTEVIGTLPTTGKTIR